MKTSPYVTSQILKTGKNKTKIMDSMILMRLWKSYNHKNDLGTGCFL